MCAILCHRGLHINVNNNNNNNNRISYVGEYNTMDIDIAIYVISQQWVHLQCNQAGRS